MPTYDYECKKCQHSLEVFQSFSEEPLTKCPNCKKNKLFRVISGGNGFFTANRTLGVLAEKNSAAFSSDMQNQLNKKNATKKAKKLKLNANQKLVDGESKITPLHQKLAKATPEQRQNYIDRGTL